MEYRGSKAGGLSLAHKDDTYETPNWLFEKIEKETGLTFDEDLCATPKNTKCISYMTKELDTLTWKFTTHKTRFCNPPRSKNGKFVDKIYEIWKELGDNIVMLLCWNDFGNKYGTKIFDAILAGDIIVKNLGKIIFDKNGKPSKYPSRLTYCYVWFK